MSGVDSPGEISQITYPADASAAASRDKRWPGRPGLSIVVRGVALLAPIAVSTGFVWLMTKMFPLPGAAVA